MNTISAENENGVRLAYASMTREGLAQSYFKHLANLGPQLKSFARLSLAQRIIQTAADARGEPLAPWIDGPRQPDSAGATADEILAAGRKRRDEM
jgi:hypothetical protein